MKLKLLAIGNVLMEDDGIAVILAEKLREELESLGLSVIIGETDSDYLLSAIDEEDTLIILDAVTMVPCGEILCLSLREAVPVYRDETQHSLSFLHTCRLYYPDIRGILLGIGVESCGYHYGVSERLSERIGEVKKILLQRIIDYIQGL